MHVLMTVNTAWNIWHFRKPIVQALLTSGHRVTVLAAADDSVGQLGNLGCDFVPLKMNAKGLNPIDEFMLFQRFKCTFKSQKPDIILSYTIKNNIFGALAARSLGIPFVPNVSGLGTGFLSGGMLQFIVECLYRRAFRYPLTIFFQNKDDQNLFINRSLIKTDQAKLLPGSGIDLEYFQMTDLPKGTTPKFLLIARILQDKGIIEFVEAARQVKAERPEVRFQLLGATDSENRTAISTETVESWVDDGTIEYLGTTSDVRPFIAAATCVVLPSFREGAPRTLIEAAAMARPLIATDVPGCRAVVDHESTGLLCKVRDPDSLATAMRRILDMSPEHQNEMGRAGRFKMEREYDHRLVVQAYAQTITELTGQGI